MARPPSFGRDGVEPGPEGSRFLCCSDAKGWLARKPATRTSAEHPGTAVRWHEEIFEVVAAAPTPDGGVRYRLEPWDPRHAIRVVANYDEANENARIAGERGQRTSAAKGELLTLLAPLVGHLPAEVQSRLGSEFGVSPRLMTIVSALPLLILGLLGTFASMISTFAADFVFPEWLSSHPFLSIYLAVESLLRLSGAFLHDEPMGSLPGVIVFGFWKTLTGRRPPAAAPNTGRSRRWEAQDVFKMIEPLAAFLPPPDQESLAERFGFAFGRWGRFTAVGVFIVAVLNIVIALGRFAENHAAFWDYFWLPVGFGLATEQIIRWRRLSAGRPAGSVLGILVRPFSRRLFEASPGTQLP